MKIDNSKDGKLKRQTSAELKCWKSRAYRSDGDYFPWDIFGVSYSYIEICKELESRDK